MPPYSLATIVGRSADVVRVSIDASFAPMRAAWCSVTQLKKSRPKSIAPRSRIRRIGIISAVSTSAWPRRESAADRLG